jgi:hypothetical protein
MPPAVLREPSRRLQGIALEAPFCYVAPHTISQPKK